MGECFALVEKEEAETILEELLEKASAKVRGCESPIIKFKFKI